MNMFHDGHVRLRSLILETYLHADEDGQHISLSPHRDSPRSAWTVQQTYPGIDGDVFLLFHSASGRYLTTTATPASHGHGRDGPHGHDSFLTEQRYYDQGDLKLQDSMWKAVRAGFRDTVQLRNVAGRYLCANRYADGNTSVTVDDEVNFNSLTYWTVEPIHAAI